MDRYRYESSSDSDRHYYQHRYHPYIKNDRGYLPDQFKKEKPPNFDGDVKKPEDAEAWILGMNKFFELHEYTNNMKGRITIFSMRGKAYIWWEYVKRDGDIRIDDMIWHEF